MKVVYDKLNNRESYISWFMDSNGDYWIDADPHGLDMGGIVKIKRLPEHHYEIREIENSADIN